MGNFAKFCPPTIANGKVYLATFSNQLAASYQNPLGTIRSGGGAAVILLPLRSGPPVSLYEVGGLRGAYS